MKALFLATAASLVLAVTPGFAAVPGVNLGWSNCLTGPTSQNRSFTCDSNDQSFTLVGSWILDHDVPDFTGIDALLDCHFEAGLTPWFEVFPGGCREGEITPRSVGSLAGCANPYAGMNQNGAIWPPDMIAPDRIRFRVGWSPWSPTTNTAFAAANTLHTGFVLGISTQLTIDEGMGVCSGCDVPVCFALSELKVTSSLGDIVLRTPDVRNWCSWHGESGSCPGATPVRPTSWGAVKALYR